MISLSDLEDDRMRHAKSGDWWTHNGHRALANNSATYNAKPDIGQFLQEWTSLYNSHSGERGIFSRAASKSQATKNGRRDSNYEFGTNPCSEIILRPYQFCNLTEVVVRAEDTVNTEEERLLGVSLTGILDNKWMGEVSDSTAKALEQLRKVSVDTNAEFAAILKVPQSAAITCVKPSGTVSQLVNSASGIHTRHSPYYIRRVRGDKKEWMDVGAWVWRNFDEISGISFLPWDGGTYRQAPYEECTKEQYEELLAKMPTSIAWDDLKEEDDNVEGAQTLACVAGHCEI